MALADGAANLRLTHAQYDTVISHCFDGFPDEACGLLAGPLQAGTTDATGEVSAAYPCENADRSARTYTVDSRDYLRAMRDAEGRGDEIIGVWHSHTHTDAYPSTDRRAPSGRPGVVVRDREPQARRAGAARVPDRGRDDHRGGGRGRVAPMSVTPPG